MMGYWVVGGEYGSTDFAEIVESDKEARFGPFASFEDALRKWSELAWQSVDACNVRYTIETK